MADTVYFPALSKAPKLNMTREYADPALRDEFENLTVATRPAFPLVKRSWEITYSPLPPGDDDLLDAFVRNTVLGGSLSFVYELPDTKESVTVRFAKGGLPRTREIGYAGGAIAYETTFKIEEV